VGNNEMISKAKIKSKFNRQQNLIRIIRFIYTAIKKPQFLQNKVHYGDNHRDKVIYLIRPNSEDGIQGLMSLFVQTMRKIDYAVSRGYIPYIDFKNYKTQYYDGISNVWESYFTQPSNLLLEEVYASKNVILSGLSLCKNEDIALFKSSIFTDNIICEKCYKLITENISLSKEAEQIVEEQSRLLHLDSCIGVYIRGTDYTKLKPSGEHIQPNIDSVIEKTKNYLSIYPNNRIFLVTEDFENYRRMKEEFRDLLLITEFDTFVQDYSGNDFLSKSNVLNDDKKQRGMDYLVKIVLLSKCKYLISSITMGSIAAYAMNGNKYDDSYIFDLGLYD
jgi:hypothetical protein